VLSLNTLDRLLTLTNKGFLEMQMKMLRLISQIFLRILWIASLASPLGAVAQTSGPSTSGSDTTSSTVTSGKDALEEVVVTATRREVNLQKLPEAVTAITADQLDQLNAQNFEDYFRTVPSLMMNSLGAGLNRFDFSIRGISDFSQTAPVKNPTVGQYLDEIPVTAVGQQIDPQLVDIERVEVLRGPQGTYFGEDSLGGTIRIITKKPDLANFSATADSRLSDTHDGGLNNSESLILNVPLLTNTLGFRGNYYYTADSGFIDGVTAGCTTAACSVASVDSKRINPDHSDGGRAMLLFKPVEQVSILAEYVHSNYVQHNTATYEPKVGDLDIIEDDLNSPARNGGGGGTTTGGGGTTTGGGGTTTGGGGTTTGGGGTTTGGGGTTTGGGGSTPSGDYAPSILTDRDDLYNITARAKFGFADLVSVSSWGYRTVVTSFPQPGSTVFNGLINNYNNYAQELRLVSSEEWSQRWDYIGGLYYQRANEVSPEDTSGASQASITDRSDDKALFADLGYKVSDQLSARVGLRKQIVNTFEAAQSPLTNGVIAASHRDSPTTGRVVVTYDPTTQSMLYGSVSTGFRPGGVNAVDSALEPGAPQTYKPDTTVNYELGWKQTFPTLHATLDVDIYHINWRDIQVAQVEAGAAGTVGQQVFENAGAAKVDGLEIEAAAQLLPALSAQMSLSVSNPVITKNEPGDSSCLRGCPARSGDQIPYVARVTGSAALKYRQAIGDSRAFMFAVLSEQYTGTRNTDFSPTTGVSNDLFIKLAANVLTKLQLGIDDGGWRAALYVDNLFDRRNPISATPSLSPPGTNNNGDEVIVDRPPTIGVWVRYNYR
jgi:iron complex outermembrane receptor protein